MNTYQHGGRGETSYNNGTLPVLPSTSASSNHSYNNNGSSGSSGYAIPTLPNSRSHMMYRGSSSSNFNNLCPTFISTYITLHLDTTIKILNHMLYITLICDIIVFVSSFSISYLTNNGIGYNTVLCTFILCTITIVTLLIINNNSISALSILAPTQYMIGVATGITCNAILITILLSTSYKSTIQLCHHILNTISSSSSSSDSSSHPTTHSNNTNSSSHYNEIIYNTDPVLIDTCRNRISTMIHIRFWCTLIGWCNLVIAALLMIGRTELSANTETVVSMNSYMYDPISTTNTTSNIQQQQQQQPHHHQSQQQQPQPTDYPPEYDFEEQFRKQQQQILGVQGVAAIRDRAAAMFVGDYSSIPEVTTQQQQQQHQPSSLNNQKSKKDGPQILSV